MNKIVDTQYFKLCSDTDAITRFCEENCPQYDIEEDILSNTFKFKEFKYDCGYHYKPDIPNIKHLDYSINFHCPKCREKYFIKYDIDFGQNKIDIWIEKDDVL